MASRMRTIFRACVCSLALAAASGGARATEGYFVEGVSARDQALGGAGMANPADALTNANNPAGLVDVGHQFNGDISAFMPSRQYYASPGPGFVAPGTVSSSRDVFAIPAIGYSLPLNADQAFGFSMNGNGGMNSTYAGNTRNPNCASLGSSSQGVFCGGRAGVDLNQALISVGYAQRFGNVSLGIAPTFVTQLFSAYGLRAFSSMSSNPANLTDRSVAWSFGAGVRAGALYRVNEQFSVGLAGSSPIWATGFTQYSGLFAQGGGFNVPGTIGAGVSYKVLPTFAVMLDWKHIFYSSVKSIGNQMTAPYLLGSDNGAGFGWRDVDVIALGLEWKYSDAITLRTGYAHNTQPITANNVTFNILAPAVVTDHISGGFTYNLNRNSGIDFAIVYALHASVTGPEITSQGPTGRSITLSMSELQLTLGYTYHMDVAAPVIAKY
jgi:long-chain fatty acid transport protein